jgi:drug/metabolite transporter (DMT)-like permease
MSEEATTADILTAASVMAGVLFFLYAHAHTRIAQSLDIERGERHAADLRVERRRVRSDELRAAAIAAVALAVGAIFTPKVIDLIRDGHVFGEYDPIALSLIVVWLLFLGVGAHSAWSAWRLSRKHRELG